MTVFWGQHLYQHILLLALSPASGPSGKLTCLSINIDSVCCPLWEMGELFSLPSLCLYKGFRGFLWAMENQSPPVTCALNEAAAFLPHSSGMTVHGLSTGKNLGYKGFCLKHGRQMLKVWTHSETKGEASLRDSGEGVLGGSIWNSFQGDVEHLAESSTQAFWMPNNH